MDEICRNVCDVNGYKLVIKHVYGSKEEIVSIVENHWERNLKHNLKIVKVYDGGYGVKDERLRNYFKAIGESEEDPMRVEDPIKSYESDAILQPAGVSNRVLSVVEHFIVLPFSVCGVNLLSWGIRIANDSSLVKEIKDSGVEVDESDLRVLKVSEKVGKQKGVFL